MLSVIWHCDAKNYSVEGKENFEKTGVLDTKEKKKPVTRKKEKIKAETENWTNLPSIGIDNI